MLTQTSNTRAESVKDNDAAVRARLAEKLSADELALLDDLERERVVHAAQGEVAEEPQSEQPGMNAADLEGAERQEAAGAPRCWRKKGACGRVSQTDDVFYEFDRSLARMSRTNPCISRCSAALNGLRLGR